MLKTTKAITLTGNSMVGERQAIYMSANITTESSGNTSINQSITDDALYKANAKECRADVKAFQQLVWDTEDAMTAEQAELNKQAEKPEDTEE